MSDKDLIAEAKDFFEEALSYESKWREEWRDDLDFRALRQWSDAQIAARNIQGEAPRPCLVVDQTDQYVRQVINDARLNPPALQAKPVDDKADIEVAESLQGLFRYIEAVSRAQTAYTTALDWSATIGRGFIRLYSDEVDTYRNLWEPRIGAINNALAVYYDPHSVELDGSDSTDAVLIVTMSKQAFKRKYGDMGKATLEWGGPDDEWTSKDTVRIAEWHSVREVMKDMVITPQGAMTVEQAAKRGIQGQTIKKKCKEARIRKLTGVEILEDTVFLGQGVGIVPVYGNVRYTQDRKEVFGLIRPAKDPQRMLNYFASNMAEAANGQSKAPWLVTAEAVKDNEALWDRANQANLPYLLYNATDEDGNPNPVPSRQNVDLNLMGYGNAMMLQQNLMQGTIGMYQAAIGAPGQEKSGIAIRERASQSDVSTYHYISNLGMSIQNVGRMIMKMIPDQYDTARVQQILGEDGTPSKVMIDPNAPVPMSKMQTEQGETIDVLNPLIGEYDIQIAIGPSFTSKREAAAESIGQIMGNRPEMLATVGDIWFANQDWPGAKEISKRLKLMLPPEVKAAEENDEVPPEVTQIVGQLQQLIQAREQGFAQAMQQLTQIGEQIKQQASQLKVESANLKTQQAQLETKKAQAAAAEQVVASKAEAISQVETMASQVGDAGQQNAQSLAMAMQMLAQAVEGMNRPKVGRLVRDETGRAAGVVMEGMQ